MKKIDIEFNINNKHIRVSVMSDLGHDAENAVVSWIARTKKFTVESFCSYVNNKGVHKCNPIKTP